MKLLIALLLFAGTLCSCAVIPSHPGGNYTFMKDDRYMWVPDGEDNFILVDTQEPLSEEEIRAAERAGEDNAYWLFTRNNPRSHQLLIHDNDLSVRQSNYNRNQPTMVLIHGFSGKGNHEMNVAIAAEYLAIANANIIVLDWGRAALGTYSSAVRAVPSVGRSLGNFLVWLVNNHGGLWGSMHLVGYSLGAHVAGNAGRTAGRRINRITGLDPAGPQFGGSSNALNRNDGTYVEAIHTDGGWYGIFDPIADADFYPNGGRHAQPGCWLNSCSHSRAHELFTASIRNNRFSGRQCLNINQVRNNQCTGTLNLNMGNTIGTKRGTGLYRLTTRASWPFHAV